jgi:outer membrane protein OmpA-like peptidoglycan-associated protein
MYTIAEQHTRPTTSDRLTPSCPTAYRRGSNPLRSLAALLLAASATIVGAQSVAPKSVGSPSPVAPRLEIFAGYSYLYPNATASGYLPNGIVPVSSCLCAIPDGGGLSLSYGITPWLNLAVDGSAHVGGKSGSNAARIGNADAYNLAAGPQFKLRRKHFEPFAEVLFGGDRLAPSAFHQDTAFGMLAGGGLDLPLGRHIALRPVQADFVYANHHFGPSPAVAATNLRGLRLQAGVVFRFGGHAPAPVPIPQPKPAPVAEVVAAPVIVAPVDNLSITANAVPAEIIVGATSIINAQGVSSLNRPLTYSFSTTMGTVQGNGAMATLNTAGAGAGTAMVTATVIDDQGKSAAATVPVILRAAPMAAIVETSKLCSMTFDRDLRRPARVTNEGKACLDDIAISLQRNSDARLALIGSAAIAEHLGSREHRKRLARERAEHSKQYLVEEKGIDAARIDVYTEERDSKSVTSVLVPSGASLDTTGLTLVSPQKP